MSRNKNLPLAGIRVIEFSHMVMGPAAGVVLADLGADVIKIEPLSGDNTRRLGGSGAGYFTMYNRNKRSICVDLKSEQGKALALRLVTAADVVIENFRPGAMDKLGFGYDALSSENPRLIYCSCRGFLSGPYEHRTALDEVAQMMSGLAYMTGPPGRPLRAGASVVDVMGGVFGVIGILAAIEQRNKTGRGEYVTSSLFESTAFLMGQHMAQQAVTGKPAAPMPVRVSAWAIYDVFNCGDGEQVFVAVVSDSQWETFCEAFQLIEFSADPLLRTNRERVENRDRIIPRVREIFAHLTKAQLMQKLEECGLPYAGIGKPSDLFEDPHLLASNGLLDVTVPGGSPTRTPCIPLQMGQKRFGLRHDVPTPGEDCIEILEESGYNPEEIGMLIHSGTVATTPPDGA